VSRRKNKTFVSVKGESMPKKSKSGKSGKGIRVSTKRNRELKNLATAKGKREFLRKKR
jgi:hypothetical protein